MHLRLAIRDDGLARSPQLILRTPTDLPVKSTSSTAIVGSSGLPPAHHGDLIACLEGRGHPVEMEAQRLPVPGAPVQVDPLQ